jgi:hypothetical protein
MTTRSSRTRVRLARPALAALLATVLGAVTAPAETVRFATFNASLNRNAAGQLIGDLTTPNNEQARTVAEIIQRVRPDVLLINEFDFDDLGPGGASVAARLFRQS